MNGVFNNLVIYNGYPLSTVVAVAFHGIILVLLIWLQSGSDAADLELVQPTIIKALFIDENPQVRNERILERQEQERQERERQEWERQERERQEQERQEQERQEQERQEQERERQERERQEQERERERERQERERQEQERERERERQERERQERERQERERQEDERRRQQEEEAARTELELVQSATALIQTAVQQVWNRPPSARNGMRAVLRIQMLPTGELLDAGITESSGDPAFDRSAENAVYRAAPFTELRSLPINVFNDNFRVLSLIFQPEDLLN